MKLQIPELCLVVLVGPSGSGKSTFAARHFKPTEIISSDVCRSLVSDDPNDQTVTKQAFDVLHYIAAQRLGLGRLTVVDATNVQAEARKPLIQLARDQDCLPVAIVLDVPPEVCQERNDARPDRQFGPHVIRHQTSQLRRSIKRLKREGFRRVHVLKGLDAIEAASFERQPLWNDRRTETGPFDIIGDIHGCYDELVTLLTKLGWQIDAATFTASHPEGRKAIFVGDLVDRGPKSPEVLKLVMAMVQAETAICVPGNHEVKLLRKLQGRDVRLTHGLAETMEQLANEPAEFHKAAEEFIRGLVSHYVLDGGELVVAHAGMKEAFQGRASGRVRQFALYGETTGETDAFGLPIRYDWASEYRGNAMVVYGHTPVPEAQWVNRTICLDTGCVFGGRLTALRYPERELVDVPAERVWYEPIRPLEGADAEDASDRKLDDLIDIKDVSGKRIVQTRIRGTVTIRDDNAAGALEVMSRFATDPHWLIYLPPTMSPSNTCKEGALLEHPREAFDYYRSNGVARVVCQEKHMGSRAVLVLARDAAIARQRFGAMDGKQGVVYTRTGRPFFKDEALEAAFIARVGAAMTTAGLWDELQTNWICLDAELMPWSAKARALLEEQYAAVGAAGRAGLSHAHRMLEQAVARSDAALPLLASVRERQEQVERFTEAYRRYCWSTDGLEGLKLAPFHIMATEGRVYTDQDHLWHMETLARLAAADAELLMATEHRVVHVTDPESEAAATAWWEQLTDKGGEGMVVKSAEWLSKGRRGLVQPAVKCRGREYLRIIYGPEYTAPDKLDRLRNRGLGSKRSLALREYALGLEALHRFVDGEPLYRIHQCVFGVLALESEPVDPRL